MNSDEKSFFEIVDEYARTHHCCLVTEMFLSPINLEYVICFRPMDSAGECLMPSSCQYIYVDVNEVQRIGQTKDLSDVLTDILDAQLPSVSIRQTGEQR